jgi:hypothetical protein
MDEEAGNLEARKEEQELCEQDWSLKKWYKREPENLKCVYFLFDPIFLSINSTS